MHAKLSDKPTINFKLFYSYATLSCDPSNKLLNIDQK